MTAVEWLKYKIIEDIRLDDLICGFYSKEQYKLFLLDKIEYAFEMEREQIQNAHLAGQNSADEVNGETEIQYFKNIYGELL